MAKRFAQESNKRINKKKNKKNGLIILIVLIIILILGVINLAKNKWNMQRTVSEMISSVTGEEVEIINALILGISEDIDTELTDTIILVSYNPYTQKSYMVSIPRDTYIGKSDTSISMYDKINSVYSKYGVDKIIEHVEKLTGVEIEYYAVVRTGALIDIVDIIGGVNFEVPIDMKYDDESQNLHIDLKKGMQKIDGVKAEKLLRFRHNNDGTSYPYEYGDNDYGRMRTQREFIKATVEQTIKFQNILKTKKIMSAAFDNLETNISLSKLLAYVPYVMSFNIDDLNLEQLPGSSVQKNGVWVYESNISKSKKLMKKLNEGLNNIKQNVSDTTLEEINPDDIEKIKLKK